MRYEVRAMSLGELLDTGFRLLRDHFVLLLGISAALWIPLSLLQAAFPPPGRGQLPAFTPTLLLPALIYLLISPVVGVAITYALGEVYLGREATIGDAFRKGLAVLMPVLGTSLLSMLAIIGATLLLIVPGIWVALGMLVLSQVMVFEGRFGGSALRRSLELMKGQRLRGLGIGLVVAILSSVIGFGAELALGIIPLVGPIASGLVSALTGAYMSAIVVVLYFDIRCRKEAFDLEHLATLVTGSREGSPALVGSPG
jgi:hypothetical protein